MSDPKPDPRIAVVGAGSLSTKRIYPYIGAAGGQLVGVCDLDRDKAERNARRFGGKAYTDMAAMLDAETPDAVIICIGPEAHAEFAPVVMRRGIPVYTEKPPAPTASAAREVARVSRETGVLCTTAFKKRYATAYDRAKQWIQQFPSEDLLQITVVRASGPYRNDSPRTDLLLDFEIHMIDLVGYLLGDAARVFAMAKGRDAYSICIEFANAAVGSLNVNDGRSFQVPTEQVEITARGGHAMSIANSSSWRIIRDNQCCEWREPPTFTSAGDSGLDTGHLAEIVDFFEAARQRRTTRSDIYESYKSMVLYEAIRQSAQTGKVVPVRYEPV